MAKKATKAKQTSAIYTSDPLQLNQWCIEMAVKWPVRSHPGYGNYGALGGGMPPQHVDEDIIARANKIMAWVRTQHT